MKILKQHKTFQGQTQFWQHDSKLTQTPMKFSTFIPSQKPVGALIWLSGLTCTEENFITKAAAQIHLEKHQLMIICPDTSPRGLQLPGEHESYDFGSGAGFYVNATTEGYKNHYRMYDYISHEIYEILIQHFGISPNSISIFGHSMGGHGALTIGLNEAEKFQSVSAFAPIVNPTQVPWGRKALLGYIGEDESLWKKHDACEIIYSGRFHKNKILIDQGLSDEFLEKNLMVNRFEKACSEYKKQSLELRLHEGYDHSYYFISTFIADHIAFHAKNIRSN